ncbi:unnamed protein product [Staurois parvus]|uniref:Uncharacterized protein n=1 Tax=Staurois parvus TaxID=386267 RepID=A0ABN9CPI1_9NEOB|nr:unnamed protein product [Staurois parvus]
MAEVAERKQLKLKAIQRPMLKSPPAAAWGDDYQEVQWQSGGAEAAKLQLKAIHRPRLKKRKPWVAVEAAVFGRHTQDIV